MSPTPPTVVYDACVLYPAPLRDLLVHLALVDAVRAKWTDAIHDEWTRSVLADRPDLTAVQLQRTRDLMDSHVRDCLVSGYEELIPTLTLPDAGDRHVLAAAIHSGASTIVTFNLVDFPATILQPLGVEAIHPDVFVVQLIEESHHKVIEAVRRQRAMLRKPPKTVEEFLATLAQCQLPATAAALRQYAEQM